MLTFQSPPRPAPLPALHTSTQTKHNASWRTNYCISLYSTYRRHCLFLTNLNKLAFYFLTDKHVYNHEVKTNEYIN